MTLSNDKKKVILEDVKKDWQSSKAPKTKVDNAIVSWTKAYNGDKYGNEVKGRSSIVIKDVKKAIKKMAPSLIQPFIASDTIIKAKPKTMKSVATSSMAADVLNYQYNNEFDKLNFIRTIASVFPKEGTIWIRTGWDYDEDVEEKSFEGLGLEELQVIQQSASEVKDVKQNPDGTFSLTAVKREVLKNRPTAIVCKNEAIYSDPTAERIEEIKFVIHEYERTLSDLIKNPNMYEVSSQMADIEKHLDATVRTADTSLGAKRYQDGINNGQDITFKFANKYNKKLAILEYWGEYDIDGSGKAEQIVVSWIKGTDIILRCEENPYPDKKIPFVSAAYDIEAFSIWGNALADAIDDNQKIHTAIMRGFIDNLSLSNNGQKFFRKGALDYINMQKLLNGEKVIEVNDIDGFRDGSYNQIPASSFQIYGMQDSEIEALTGVSRNLDGIDDATIGRTSSGVNTVMTAAQRHMVILVAVIADLYKQVFERWHSYNQVFLDENQAIEISGDLYELSKKEISGSHTIEVQVNVDAMNQQKVQQINMLLQQSQALQGQIPPNVIPALVAEIFSSFGKEEQAEMIRNYQPQPDPMQQQMMQLEMMKLQVEIEYYKAQTAQEYAKANNTEAQARHHMAKIDSTDMDTLKKAEELKQLPSKLGLEQAKVDNDYMKTAVAAHQAKNKPVASASKK